MVANTLNSQMRMIQCAWSEQRSGQTDRNRTRTWNASPRMIYDSQRFKLIDTSIEDKTCKATDTIHTSLIVLRRGSFL